MAGKKRKKRAGPHHNVYVVLLDNEVLTHERFRNENPGRDPLKPCLYVGMTGKTPVERFRNHQRGYKSNSYVYRYGVRLLPAKFEHLNPMKYEAAAEEEKRLADRLRTEGYAVWQK